MMRRTILAAALAATLVAGAHAGQPIEELLPDTTFMYGGVHQLEAGYEKIVSLIATNLPFTAEFTADDRMLLMLAREFGLEGVATRAEFLAHTGLDPAGSAAIAWVPIDPSYAPYRRPNENVLLIFPVKDRARVEQLVTTRLMPLFAREAPGICSGIVRRIDDAKRTWKATPHA
ncbi:hypothetical protein HQ560_11460, partial [bacterium]|nr:hypothetical protein [bacterium]